MPHCAANRSAYVKKYRANPVVRAKYLAYQSRPDVKARQLAQRPAQYQARRKTPEGRAKLLLYAARQRAKQHGLQFDLTLDWLLPKVQGGVCEATGLSFDFVDEKRAGCNFNPYAPSLDRDDATKGYTRDNCKVVVNVYNVAKGQWSEEVLRALVTALAKRY